MMTRNDAVDRAAQLAAARGWTWLEPIEARLWRPWVVGRARWVVVSNAQSRGCNVRVVIDAASGDIVEEGVNPR